MGRLLSAARGLKAGPAGLVFKGRSGREEGIERLGIRRLQRSGNPPIAYGLITNAQGCPVAVEEKGFGGHQTRQASVRRQRADRVARRNSAGPLQDGQTFPLPISRHFVQF